MQLRIVTALAVVAGCTSPNTSATDRALDGASDPFALERAAAKPWVEGGFDDDLEARLAEAISAGYASHDTRVVVRHALAQWARLVRRHLAEPLHTAVPGLIDDPDCAGSVIGDHALVDYAQAIADGDEATTEGSTTAAVTALQTLARHMACLGEAQSSHLATQMVIAFDDVEASLQITGRASALPYLAQAIAQPMLIVQDVERQYGPTAPLARWFAQHAALLAEGAGGFHHPATWHGLWLYDRSIGRLVGFRATQREDATTENVVDLGALYATVALATPEDTACSLVEMLHRGRGASGYACKGQRCANEASADCHEASTADSTSGDANGLSLPGLVTAEALACVASQVVRPGQQQMTCVLEASGHAAQPREQLVKELTAVPLAGVKVGDECTIAEGDNDPYDAAIQAARDQYEKDVAAMWANITKLIEELKAAQALRDAAFQNYGPNSGSGLATQNAVDTATQDLNDALGAIPAELDKAANNRDMKIDGAEAARASRQPVPAPPPAPAPTSSCDPRSPIGAACGNGCGAMAHQAARFAACFVDKPGELDPYRGQCGKSCDPSEPAVDMPASASCLATLETDNPTRIQARECWAARCGSADQAADGCCGPDKRTATGSPVFPDLCAQAQCDGDQTPTTVHGRCECGSTFDPTAPRIPFGPEPRPR